MSVAACSLYKMSLLFLRSFSKSLVCHRPFQFSREKPFSFCAQFGFCWFRSCCRSLFLSATLIMKILRPGLCDCFCKSKERSHECSWEALSVCIMHRCTDIVLVMWSNVFLLCTTSSSFRAWWCSHWNSLTCTEQNQILWDESGCTKAALNVWENQKLGIWKVSIVQMKWLLLFFNMQADRMYEVPLYFTPTWCILFGNFFFFLGELGANDKLFFILGNTAEDSWIIYFMHFSLVYLDACKLTL